MTPKTAMPEKRATTRAEKPAKAAKQAKSTKPAKTARQTKAATPAKVATQAKAARPAKAPEPAKLDLRKQLPSLYRASAKKVDIVDVPAMLYLMLDGTGDPNSSEAFSEAVAALYALAYTLKFQLKAEGGPDFSVMPLEGLWWADDMASFRDPSAGKSGWKWTLMIAQPDVVTVDQFERARETVADRKAIAAATRIRLATFHEGPAAQTLHVGPYAAEQPTIERVHREIAARGRDLTGKHHEIYLGDPRRSAPEKLRTIVRQPFA